MFGNFSSILGGIQRPGSQVGQTRVDPNQAFRGDQGASELLGKLNRAQWRDWRDRFAPYIEDLAAAAQNSGAPASAGRQASLAMGTAFDANQQAREQDRQAFGLQQTGAQAEVDDRRSALQRRASMVSAGNQARISAQDRQQSILAGGMGLSNIPDKVMNQ